MMQVSIVGFAVGGAFLSIILFDVPYYLIGATLVAGRLLDQNLMVEKRATEVTSPVPAIAATRQSTA